MPKLIFDETGEEFEIASDGSIIEACEEIGVPFACTEGVCGTCVITVTKGIENLSPYNEAEQDFLGDTMTNERLACQCRLQKGTVHFKM
jgi:ferredoxin